MIRFLLTNGQYRRYWIGRWFSDLGDWIRNMALIFVVMDFSHDSSRAIAINMFCEFTPMFIAPLLGVFVDRWDRKRTLMWSTTARGVLLAGIAISLHYHSLYLIYLGAFLGSVATVFTQTASSGLIMQIVAQEERKTAASLKQIISSTMTLVGPPIGAFIYSFTQSGSLWLAFGLFVATAALISGLTTQPVEQSNESEQLRSVFADFKAGWQYAGKNPVVPVLLTVGFALGISGGILNVLEVFIVTQFLHLPQTMLATLLSIQGVGMLVSVPFANKLKLPVQTLLPISVLILGVGLAVMVSYPILWVTVLGYLIFSFGNIAENIAMGTLLQTEIHSDYQGRILSLLQTVSMGTMGIIILFTGLLHRYLSVRQLVLVAASVALGVGTWVLLRKRLRSPDRMELAQADAPSS